MSQAAPLTLYLRKTIECCSPFPPSQKECLMVSDCALNRECRPFQLIRYVVWHSHFGASLHDRHIPVVKSKLERGSSAMF